MRSKISDFFPLRFKKRGWDAAIDEVKIIKYSKCYKCVFLYVSEEAIMVVSMTCRRTLNPSWCLFRACVTAQSEWTMALPLFPILPLNWMELNQSSCADWSQPARPPRTDRCWSPQHLLRGLHSSPAACPWSPGVIGGPRQGLCPILFWMAWVWTSCKGGSEMENSGRCVHVWRVLFLCLSPTNCWWCYDCA